MTIYTEIMDELSYAMKKYPEWPTDPLHAIGVVAEEVGECQREIMLMTYEPAKSNNHKVRAEAIQMAAMAIRFIASIDKYEYRPCANHKQDALT